MLNLEKNKSIKIYIGESCSCLLSGIRHRKNGSPVNPGLQLQTGMWLITRQLALVAHIPKQGSPHFSLMQARLLGQSELTRHCGRHIGGVPRYPGWQEQTAIPSPTLQELYGPHGLGQHGVLTFLLAG